ncbi:MAG: hypothetical protein R3181_13855 [Rubricoccaceae bacterium]|nr:hypothetical protein [Rubricoccaceae bacterium]
MRRPALLALVLTAAALSGCFQFQTLLRLEPDGSGTIEETVLLSDLIRSMLPADSTEALYDEAAVVARADSFGAGVRFVRVDTLAEGGFSGYRAVYAFDDVNAVRLLPGSGEAAGLSEGGGEGAGMVPALAFDYAPGEALRITIPRETPDADAVPLDSAAVETQAAEVRQQVQEAAMMRGFLTDARLAVAVALPAPVAETNARYVEGDTVTLVDLNFGAFLDLMETDPEVAARLQLAETAEDREAVLRALNDFEGLRFEPEESVTLTFE